MVTCACKASHARRRIVLTGGPGGGKTALLELIRRSFCEHVHVLPESASVVFGGGFPRDAHVECQRAAQRAIFHVQRELEATGDSHHPAVVVCDRGTPDGLAYWPGPEEDFWESVASSHDAEMRRYDAVIHLRTPGEGAGYNHQNPLRTESAGTAAEVDVRILEVWQRHPRRFVVASTAEFLDKCSEALRILRDELPECCRDQVIPALRDSAG